MIVTDWRDLPDELRGAAVAIGAFDGVHRGHQAVIAQGIHGDAARGADGRLDPARAAELLKAETTYARYAALDLAW